MATTVFPNIDVTAVALIGGALLAVGLLAFGLVTVRSRRRARRRHPGRDRAQGPQRAMDDAAARAARPGRNGRPAARVAMLTLRGYLVVAMILLLIKAIQLGGG